MPINSVTSFASSNTPTYNSASSKSEETTSIKKDNGYYGAKEKAMDLLRKHYDKMNRENKSYADPLKHIADKYFNHNSPWFRSDMTHEERRISSRNEKKMLQSNNFTYYYNDTALGDSEPIYTEIEDYKRIQHDRNAITAQIKQLFQDNHIIIPSNVSLKFSINPYDYTLKVTGSDDENLINTMEKILNTCENSKNLYEHISKAARNSGDSTQLTKEKKEKHSLYWTIKHETGYDLRELKHENGRFYTEDGKDILDIFKNHSNIPAAYRSDVLGYYTPILQKFMKTGFHDGNDLILSIGYKNGELFDIGQTKMFGPGQNESF